MKKTLVFTALVLLFTSCAEFFPGDGRFYVKIVQEGKSTTNYQVVPLGSGGIGATWIEGERGAYHVGDTLYLKPTK